MNCKKALLAIALSSVTNSAWCAPANYVIQLGYYSNYPSYGWSLSTAGFADFHAEPQPQSVAIGSFRGMPKSAYKVTVTVRCQSATTYGVTGTGTGDITARESVKLTPHTNNGAIGDFYAETIDACVRKTNEFNLQAGRNYSNDNEEIETLTWIIKGLTSGQHTFEIEAELDSKATLKQAADGSITTYINKPQIHIDQVIIEPINLKMAM